MKSYNQLSPAQQERAVEESLRRLLRAVTVGGLRFNDIENGNDLQRRIDAAYTEIDDNSQVGFQGEEHNALWGALVLERCQPELLALARMAARDAVYSEGETVISLDDL